ncbi:MAG: PTS sugar transporter subunit IIA [Phycisphaeraceae bacterium]|nr:PTS sugar transporter subunit IIA [Phycisphaeraceae bacterium]
MIKLRDYVAADAVVAQLKSADRDGAIEELVDGLVKAGCIPKTLRQDLINMIVDRERKGSTGFGKGVAVPHVKHEKIKKMAAAIGVSQKGLDFNALDKSPVYSVFLLLSPVDKPDEHLQAMENIFSHLQQDTFRRFLRQATTTKQILDLIEEADAQQV